MPTRNLQEREKEKTEKEEIIQKSQGRAPRLQKRKQEKRPQVKSLNLEP